MFGFALCRRSLRTLLPAGSSQTTDQCRVSFAQLVLNVMQDWGVVCLSKTLLIRDVWIRNYLFQFILQMRRKDSFSPQKTRFNTQYFTNKRFRSSGTFVTRNVFITIFILITYVLAILGFSFFLQTVVADSVSSVTVEGIRLFYLSKKFLFSRKRKWNLTVKKEKKAREMDQKINCSYRSQENHINLSFKTDSSRATKTNIKV